MRENSFTENARGKVRVPRETVPSLISKIVAFSQELSGRKWYPYQEEFARRVVESVLLNDGSIITALFSRQCLHKLTPVTMADGSTKCIEDITVGDKVLSVNSKTHIAETDTVYEVSSVGRRQQLKITLEGGKVLNCSKEHRILTFFGWKEADHISFHDYVAVLNPADRKPKWEKVRHIEKLPAVKMYDIETHKNHNFIANGIVVHNSGKSTTIADIALGLMTLLPALQNLPYYEARLPECLFKTHQLTGERIYRFHEGFWVGIYAPVDGQASSTFDKCKLIIEGEKAKAVFSVPDFNINLRVSNGDTIGFSNGSVVRCGTASPNANIEGKTYHMVIVDEAQDVESFKIGKSLAPMLASTNGTMTLIGTPNNKKSFFYEMIHKNKRNERETQVRNHFEFDWRYAAKYNQDYAKYVEGQRKAIGEDSDEFQLAYCLRWLMERGMFITREMLCGTPDDRFAGLGQNYDIVPFDKKNRHVAGIDVAKESDSTVVTVLEVDFDHPEVIEQKVIGSGELLSYKVFPKRVIAWLELQGDNYEDQFYRIIDFLNNFNIEHVEIDSTNGGGDALKDRMALYYDQIIVNGYRFLLQTKSELYKHLKQEMHSQRITFPYSIDAGNTQEVRRFIHQLENLEREYRGQHMLVRHPEGRDQHDDYCFPAGTLIFVSEEP